MSGSHFSIFLKYDGACGSQKGRKVPRGLAPTLGQHSYEIMAEFLGFSDEQIAEAYACGAVA